MGAAAPPVRADTRPQPPEKITFCSAGPGAKAPFL
jgi:hypothetical protein